MTGETSEPMQASEAIDKDLQVLAKALATFGADEWDALDARLGTALALPLSQLGVLRLMDRLVTSFPREKLSLGDAYTLIPVLAVPERNAQFAKVALPEVVTHVDALRYRHGSVVDGLWSAYGEAEDWSRVDVEFWQQIYRSGPATANRVRVTTTRKDGSEQTLETTPSGLLRYIGRLLREIVDPPDGIAKSIDVGEWEDFMEELGQSLETLRNRWKSGERSRSEQGRGR
jgi:hypothetical protein